MLGKKSMNYICWEKVDIKSKKKKMKRGIYKYIFK